MSAKYNLVADQATTFTFQFTVATDGTAWNLNGYTATMTVRPFLGSTTTTLLATTANGKIVFNNDAGRITVTFSSTETNITPNRYVYDLVLDSGSVETRLLEGKFIVTPGVTV
jgi:Tfp pilus assembly protein FimT